MIGFFKTIIYIPLYNFLLVILNYIPGHDVGVAIILLTVIVKFILYPFSKKAATAQFEMKKREPELQALKEKYKGDKEKQATEMLAFYKRYKINPFSGIFTALIQIPVIYSLYYIFLHSGLPIADNALKYSFITAPANISMIFLGFIDVGAKNIFLAALAALTTYFQIKMSTSSPTPQTSTTVKNFGTDLASTMASQMKYTFPIIVFLISWRISGAVALYWLVSNLFTIVQDYFIKKKLSQVAN